MSSYFCKVVNMFFFQWKDASYGWSRSSSASSAQHPICAREHGVQWSIQLVRLFFHILVFEKIETVIVSLTFETMVFVMLVMGTWLCFVVFHIQWASSIPHKQFFLFFSGLYSRDSSVLAWASTWRAKSATNGWTEFERIPRWSAVSSYELEQPGWFL